MTYNHMYKTIIFKLGLSYSMILHSNSLNSTFGACRPRLSRLFSSYNQGKLVRNNQKTPLTYENNSLNFSKYTMQTNSISLQQFHYFLVLDFEATCDQPITPKPQEIIEFPVLKVNGKTFEIESIFHSYVKPMVNPELSFFCTELTGIVQDQVENQQQLDKVLKNFDNWLISEGLFEPNVNFTFVTCGDWDLRTMLQSQCQYFSLPVPVYFKSWINIKKSFVQIIHTWPKTLPIMLEILKLPFVGRHHSGIDDCRNIATVLKALALQGHVFAENGFYRD